MKKFYPNTIVQVLLLTFISMFMSTPVIFIINVYLKGLPRDLTDLFLYSYIILAFILCVVVINKRNNIKFKLIYRVDINQYAMMLIFFLVAFQVVVNFPAVSFLEHLFSYKPILIYKPESYYLLIGIIALGPILEEIFFRGIILKGLLTRYKPGMAILISAMLFALAHGKPIQIIGAFPIGIILGSVYYKTKSIGLTTLGHSFVNLTGVIISKAHTLAAGTTFTTFYGDYTLFIITIASLILLISVYFLKGEWKLTGPPII